MKSKEQLLAALQDEFNRWQKALDGLSEEEATARTLPANRSVHDVLVHLWAWQQRSIARLEAALGHGEPNVPGWPAGVDPEAEEGVEQINAWVRAKYADEAWPVARQRWHEGFERFLELAAAVPEEELLAPGRFTWLDGHPLYLVLVGSHEHHQEHRAELLARPQP
jgi:hypothetical protein